MVKELDAEIGSGSLLESIKSNKPPIQVILDVGALIVDLNNEQVARRWLGITPSAQKQAVIFLDKQDDILVLNRAGFVEPFHASPFAGNTDACLVFLDEAHTRGINLILPDDYRAATILGPKLTKDWLVQACMRLRKLGKGQSITFIVPAEIQMRIREVCNIMDGASLAVSDVLCWSITETWAESRKSIPLWAMQGLRHQRQEAIWTTQVETRDVDDISGHDLASYFEDEAMSLEARYCPKGGNASQVLQEHFNNPLLAGRHDQIDAIKDKCERFQLAHFDSASFQEEQERELAPEIEQERQVEKPPGVQPEKHSLHPNVLSLVESGGVPRKEGFLAAFRTFERSSMAHSIRLDHFGRQLLILSLESLSILVVLSPYEANELLPRIEKSSHVRLRVYASRHTLSLPSLQHLSLNVTPPESSPWTAPRTEVMHLNLFAGQLYFQSMHEYRHACAYLGLSVVPNNSSSDLGEDGFVGQSAVYPDCGFTRSPTAFLHFVMANVRRNRQDISKTHVGRMLAGDILCDGDFLDES
ncbi:Uu.00g024350.m01.CDS01 [Anthostomella pinea]|uniref:ubiquitinyl hydrolase 1 n=1 Tax=Anthostomella pinea TaxID=933095 RepID=A0AAI8YR68_9PEZI|nr:Uu.00g024350.m01.CDS01 [Anthostomella pinea]